MAEEMNEEIIENKVETEGEKINEEKTDFPALKRAEELMSKFEEKEKALMDKEKALNEKIEAFDKKAAEIKMGGFGTVSQPKTYEEQCIEEANRFLDGSGLDPFREPIDAFSKKNERKKL